MEGSGVVSLCLVTFITAVVSDDVDGHHRPLIDGDGYILSLNQSAKYWASGWDAVSWRSAQNFCESTGGSMAYPRTQYEAELMTSFFDSDTFIWINARKHSDGESLISTDGTVVDVSHGSRLFRTTLTDDIASGDSSCLTLKKTWHEPNLLYDEMACDEPLKFVCRKLVPQTEYNSILSTTVIETGYTERSSTPNYSEMPSTRPTLLPPSHRFRADYEYYSDESAYYKVHRREQIWDDANASCSDEGAELMYPRSSTELQLMQRLTRFASLVWTGAHCQNIFHTTDGRHSDALSKELLPESSPACAAYLRDGRFKWMSSFGYMPFVCRKAEESLILDRDCDTTVLGYELGPDGTSCYKVPRAPLTWLQARRWCQAEHATLAVVNSRAEAEHLINITRRTPDDLSSVLIGVHDIFSPQQYETVDGKSLRAAGYDTWWESSSRGNPDGKHCGVLMEDATLDIFDCNTEATFVCEKELTPICSPKTQ